MPPPHIRQIHTDRPHVKSTYTEERLPNGKILATFEQKIDPVYWKELEDRAVAAYQERHRIRAEVTRAFSNLLDRIDRGWQSS